MSFSRISWLAQLSRICFSLLAISCKFSLLKFYCSVEDAKRLIDLIQGIPCKINLITFNPHSGSFFKPTTREKIIEFRDILAEAGCVVLFRWSRGDDQMAACGQLGKPGEIQAPVLRVPSQFQAVLEAAAWFRVLFFQACSFWFFQKCHTVSKLYAHEISHWSCSG